MLKTIRGPDGKPRCHWSSAAPQFFDYHDTEWGFPVADDRQLFEKLCLEAFQSGLSWRTILAKRDNFRAAFHDFDIGKVARLTQRDVTRLLKNEGIVRNRGKIEAVIHNARRALEVIERDGSLAAYLWRFEPPAAGHGRRRADPTSSAAALSTALKKQGWKFVGPTTVYSFMQAMGLVNDHVQTCIIRSRVDRARRQFSRPLPQTQLP